VVTGLVKFHYLNFWLGLVTVVKLRFPFDFELPTCQKPILGYLKKYRDFDEKFTASLFALIKPHLLSPGESNKEY